jgi:hypothetical protein
MESLRKRGVLLNKNTGCNTLLEEAYRIYMICDYWEGADIWEIEPERPYSYWPWGGTA